MTKLHRILGALTVFIAASLSPLRAYSVPEMKEMEVKVEGLVAKNMPAVVSLLGETIPGAGSGTIISADGLILTAAHVTRGNERMAVVFPDGHSVKCKVLGSNYTSDIGLAKIEEAGTYPCVEPGNSDKLAETTIVVAMGHPGGFDLRRTPPARIGRINLLNPGGFLMSDCTLVGGDSGGPLFDLDGKLVGIHSSISEGLTFNRHAPVNAAKNDWDKLLAGKRWGTLPGETRGNRKRAVLGALLDMTTQGGAGLKEVPPRTPAAEAGLMAGDLIVKFNGRDVKDAATLKAMLRKSKPGKQVALGYRRNETDASTSVTLTSEAELSARMAEGKDGPPRKEPGQEPNSGPAPQPAPPAQQPPTQPDARNPLAELLDNLRKPGQPNTERRELQLSPQELDGMLRSLLEKQGIPGDQLKDTAFPELLRMAQERNPAGAQGIHFDGLAQLRELLALIDPQLQQKLDAQFRGMLDGHRPGGSAAAEATFIFRDGKSPRKLLGFGTGVQAQGWLLTKASEVVPCDKLECEVHGEWLPAKVARTWQEHDLALVKIEAKDLPVVTWSAQGALVIGTFIAAAAPAGDDPAAIGLVSVAARNHQQKGRGFLGVQLDADPQGLKIREVVAGGVALTAGVQRDDRILEVDGQKPDSIFNFTKLISERKAGETVRLKLQRGEAVIEKEIALGDRASVPASGGDRRSEMMDSMGSTVSQRKDDFANVMQTDFPLDANQCGGPVTDLDGNVVGLVIARSGRVETLVIPSTTLCDLLATVDFAKEAAGL
jgi:serine protease Do